MRAMRTRWLVAVIAAAGCGRIGYDPAAVDAQGDSAEAGPPPGALMACDQPVQLIDLGDTGGAAASTFALDVAATTTGFVAAWQTGGSQTHTSGLALGVDASGPHLATTQSDAVAATKEGPIAIAAVGDQVLLAVDDAANAGVKFLPLDAGATRIDAPARSASTTWRPIRGAAGSSRWSAPRPTRTRSRSISTATSSPAPTRGSRRCPRRWRCGRWAAATRRSPATAATATWWWPTAR
jgi:hypothetical protein